MTQELLKRILVIALIANLSTYAMENNEEIDDTKEANNYFEQNRNSPEDLKNLLIEMARWEKPNLEVAEKILKLGVPADAKIKGNALYDFPRFAALISAAERGHTDFVKLLLDHGANIELKDPWDGRTALMGSALYGHTDTAAFLIGRGANVNAQNCIKKTSLMFASYNAKVDTVNILLKAKADVAIGDEEGKTALSMAQEASYTQWADQYKKIVTLLDDAGAKK